MSKRWTNDETGMLVRLWTERVGDYRNEKNAFYRTAADSIADKDWKSVKNRCEFLERKCESIRVKMRGSGFGNSSTDPPAVRADITKMLPWYYELNVLLDLSLRVSVPPRAIPTRTSPRRTASTPRLGALNVGEQPQGHAARPVRRALAPAMVIPLPTPTPLPKAPTPKPKTKSNATAAPTSVAPNPSQPVEIEALDADTSPTSNPKKRKQPEPSLAEVLRDFGTQWQAVEREHLALKQRQFEFEMVARREELDLRREQAEQRQEFELKFQTLRAQYELDKAAFEAKLRKTH